MEQTMCQQNSEEFLGVYCDYPAGFAEEAECVNKFDTTGVSL
jgi:hypothetical protein